MVDTSEQTPQRELLSATVRAALADLRPRGPVASYDLANSVFARHPEYGKGLARKVTLRTSARTHNTVEGWIEQIREIYPYGTLITGRLLLLGLAALDPFVENELQGGGLISAILAEVRDPSAAATVSKHFRNSVAPIKSEADSPKPAPGPAAPPATPGPKSGADAPGHDSTNVDPEAAEAAKAAEHSPTPAAPHEESDSIKLAHLISRHPGVKISPRLLTALRYAGEIGAALGRPADPLLFVVATMERSSETDPKDTGRALMNALRAQLDPKMTRGGFTRLLAQRLLDHPTVESFAGYAAREGWEEFAVRWDFPIVFDAAVDLAKSAGLGEVNPRHVIAASVSHLPQALLTLQLQSLSIDLVRLRSELLEFVEREHAGEYEAWKSMLEPPVTEGSEERAAAGPTPAPATESSEPEAVSRSGASDQPTSRDALGFAPYVRALAEFLAHRNTVPPLTVSVEGEWGSGKSSFMLQLEEALGSRIREERRRKLWALHGAGLLRARFRRFPRWLRNAARWGGWRVLYVPDWARADLRRTRCLTVRFNAWRHDKEDALWASFALEFVRQLSRQLSFGERCRARAALLFRRSNWLGWLALLRSGLLALLILVLTAALVSLVRAGGLEETLRFAGGGGAPDPGKVFGLVLKSAGVAGYVAGLIFVVSKFRDYVGDPFAVNLKQYLESPDYRSRVAFVESFHEDFRRIVETYAGDSKVYVFVDDLDRCEVPKSADLMQALNLLIADSRNLVFVIGMDREKVAAGLAVKYEKLLPYLAGAAGGRRGAGRGGPGRRVGPARGCGDSGGSGPGAAEGGRRGRPRRRARIRLRVHREVHTDPVSRPAARSGRAAPPARSPCRLPRRREADSRVGAGGRCGGGARAGIDCGGGITRAGRDGAPAGGRRRPLPFPRHRRTRSTPPRRDADDWGDGRGGRARRRGGRGAPRAREVQAGSVGRGRRLAARARHRADGRACARRQPAPPETVPQPVPAARLHRRQHARQRKRHARTARQVHRHQHPLAAPHRRARRRPRAARKAAPRRHPGRRRVRRARLPEQAAGAGAPARLRVRARGRAGAL